jgi:acyl-CoA thioesterase-1
VLTPRIPEVMRRELSELSSNGTINVINSGRIGDTNPDNIARFERDVLAHTPDLVVWQLGTNDVAWGGRPDDRLKSSLVEGVRVLKASSADAVLMDLQYASWVLAWRTPQRWSPSSPASLSRNMQSAGP